MKEPSESHQFGNSVILYIMLEVDMPPKDNSGYWVKFRLAPLI